MRLVYGLAILGLGCGLLTFAAAQSPREKSGDAPKSAEEKAAELRAVVP